jgi:class 3 adenylate cyclase
MVGDGVNIAARLEALAFPGGVCVSGRAYDDVAHKLDLQFDEEYRPTNPRHEVGVAA